ncbi:hypothetical protein HD554DRAFT_1172727 [Boletus coccyginus]|nr:hypothetical protein HD554DRAFT_1172727 [Boletus coccyginus]
MQRHTVSAQCYCSPRQLSLSLRIVMPCLTGLLTDTYAQVKASANKSLGQFGDVISNPEIQALVPMLLKALMDPRKTTNVLSALLETSLMHYIDHSSLALWSSQSDHRAGVERMWGEGKKRRHRSWVIWCH